MAVEDDRTLLHSLEVEFGLDSPLTKLSILAQGLFSPQICLIDQHLLDNVGVKDFFLEHERALLDSVDALEDYEVPLFGTCGRGGTDCAASLDEMLRPRDNKPPRLSSLSHEQTEYLTEGYADLPRSKRREKFLAIKGAEGQDYVRYLDIATTYFESDPNRTVVTQKRSPEDSLFEATATIVNYLQNTPSIEMSDTDKLICDALLNEISKTTEARKTRQRLHNAIYGQDFPPYHRGVVMWSTVRTPRDDTKDQWRFLVNDIYNHNLAESFGLSSAQDFRPRLTRFQQALDDKLDIQKPGPVRLECPIYIDYLTLDFVLKVRKQKQFWDNLRNPMLDPVVHRQYIAQEFAKHLKDDCDREDLVGKKVAEVVVIPLKTMRLLAPPIVAAVFFYKALPAGYSTALMAAGGAYTGTEAMTNRICRGLEDYFATIGQTTGQSVLYKKKFRTFIDRLEEVTTTGSKKE